MSGAGGQGAGEVEVMVRVAQPQQRAKSTRSCIPLGGPCDDLAQQHAVGEHAAYDGRAARGPRSGKRPGVFFDRAATAGQLIS